MKPLATLGLSVLAALVLAGCARSLDMSVASLHQKPPEFDFLVYQEGWACLSDTTPGRDAACAPGRSRQLRDLFAQRSTSRPLRDYLTENGATCRSTSAVTTCTYTRTFAETAPALGRASSPSREDGFELVVSFPARDTGLSPEQIATAMRRVTRVL